MKIGILLFEQFHGRENIGSSRIRGRWLAKYWPEAEISKIGARYDVIIYQKVYWIEHAQNFGGIKILDMCDADFLHWGYRIKQMIDLCDAVTTSTVELAKYMTQLTDKPVWVIPDRINFEEIGDLKKDHRGQGDARTIVWYGYSDNYPMLESAVGCLKKNGIKELIVISNKRQPFMLPAGIKEAVRLVNIPWTLETINRDILLGDIVLNPQLKSGRWKYKSENKTTNAWALGMPVAHNEVELKMFISEEARIAESEKRYKEVHEIYDVKKSVEEYKKLIEELKNK